MRSGWARFEHACYLLMWTCLCLYPIALLWSVWAYEA